VARARASGLESSASSLRIACAPEFAIAVDGTATGCLGAFVIEYVDPGVHQVRYQSTTERSENSARVLTVDIKSGGNLQTTVELPKLLAPSPPRLSGAPLFGYVALGAGALSMAAGATLVTVGKLRYDAVATDCVGGCTDAAFTQRNSARDLATGGIGAFVAGTLLAATATVILLWPRSKSAPRAALLLAPAQLGVRVGF
jgi:hypothetical protein